MTEDYSMEALGLPSMDALGLLRIRVRRGINLAVRDIARSSDPYVIVECGSLVSLSLYIYIGFLI